MEGKEISEKKPKSEEDKLSKEEKEPEIVISKE